MGRPVSQTPGELKRGFHERALYMCSQAESALADLQVDPKPGFQRFIRREPLGVVLVVAPWNYPWLTSVNAVIPALLAGNSVILKMAAQTPLVAERYAEAFKAAGLPEGVFQFLHLSHDQVAQDDRRPAHRVRRLHRLGSRRPGGAARRRRALHRHGPGARRQRPGLRARRRGPQVRGREPGRRQLLQLRPVVLRYRANLCSEIAVQRVRGRLRRAHAAIQARQSAGEGNQSRTDGAQGRGRQRARADQAGHAKRREGAAQAKGQAGHALPAAGSAGERGPRHGK